MKRIGLFFIMLISALFLLSSCADGETGECLHVDTDGNSLCDECGESYTDGGGLPSEGEGDASSDTCEHADGNGDLICDICGEQLTESDGHTHSFGEWSFMQYDGIPFCDNKKYERVCAVCGVSEIRDGEFEDHDFSAVTVDPTCESDGSRTTTCSLCNYTESELLPAIGHSPVKEYSTSPILHSKSCSACGKIIEEADHSAKLGQPCSVCGRALIPTDGINYAVSEDGGYAEVIYYGGDESEVIISDTYDSLPVRTIAAEAFLGHHLTRVLIPDTVTFIDDDAFRGCQSLVKLTIPKNVARIDNDAFFGCESLGELILDGSLPYIGLNAFALCDESLYTAEGSLTYIAANGNPHAILFRATDIFISEAHLNGNTLIIAQSAFADRESLAEVSIPASVRKVCEHAFADCYSLKRVYIEDLAAWCNIELSYEQGYTSSPLYYGAELYLAEGDRASVITDLVIPDGVSTLACCAFLGLKSIRSVTVPSGVKVILESAFEGCSSIESVYTDGNDEWLGIEFKNAASNPLYYAKRLYVGTEGTAAELTELSIRENVAEISDFAFINCESLKTVRFHSPIRRIGEDAFLGCTSLIGVYINDLSAWCDTAFSSVGSNPIGSAEHLYLMSDAGDALITRLVIPSTADAIPDYAFYGAKDLSSVYIPSGVATIGASAFGECSSLESVYVSETDFWFNIRFSDRESNPFFHAEKMYVDDGFTSIEVKELTAPESASKINDYAFYGWESIERISLHNRIESIGNSAFYGCTSLAEVTLPDSVEEIKGYAFEGCSALRSVSIGREVSRIGEYAFARCSALKDVVIHGEPETIGRYAFCECTSLEFIVIPDSVVHVGLHAFFGCKGLVICAEAEFQPETWHLEWRPIIDTTVLWGYSETDNQDI